MKFGHPEDKHLLTKLVLKNIYSCNFDSDVMREFLKLKVIILLLDPRGNLFYYISNYPFRLSLVGSPIKVLNLEISAFLNPTTFSTIKNSNMKYVLSLM